MKECEAWIKCRDEVVNKGSVQVATLHTRVSGICCGVVMWDPQGRRKHLSERLRIGVR